MSSSSSSHYRRHHPAHSPNPRYATHPEFTCANCSHNFGTADKATWDKHALLNQSILKVNGEEWCQLCQQSIGKMDKQGNPLPLRTKKQESNRREEFKREERKRAAMVEAAQTSSDNMSREVDTLHALPKDMDNMDPALFKGSSVANQLGDISLDRFDDQVSADSPFGDQLLEEMIESTADIGSQAPNDVSEAVSSTAQNTDLVENNFEPVVNVEIGASHAEEDDGLDYLFE